MVVADGSRAGIVTNTCTWCAMSKPYKLISPNKRVGLMHALECVRVCVWVCARACMAHHVVLCGLNGLGDEGLGAVH